MRAEEFFEERAALVPLWREGLALAEWAALRVTPVFWGVGVPRGDGAAVVPIPGFMGTDAYLGEMRRWLRRIGYRPLPSGIGQNADCLDRVGRRLLETIDEASQLTGRRVHLVGHSLGGIVARTAARLRPEVIATVTTMGSPIRGLRSHPLVMRMGQVVRREVRQRYGEELRHPECFSGDCGCEFVRATGGSTPEQIPERAIYTRRDGVVAWRFTRHPEKEKNIEVPGTHSGLAFNALAFWRLACFLAEHPAAAIAEDLAPAVPARRSVA